MTTDFDAVAHEIMELSDRSVKQRTAVLKKHCPWILTQIRQDAVPTGPLQFWGKCANVDEFTATTIVSPAVMETLAAVAGIRASTNPHAGLQHTYGYLFSVISTPFGKKRDRWINDAFARAFDLPPGTFGPRPAAGTLLSNTTWLAGHVAFRNESRLDDLCRFLKDRIPATLQALSLEHRPSLRLCETIALKTQGGSTSEIQFRTDLMELPKPEQIASPRSYLLVYSIADSRRRFPQIITLFQVSEDFRTALESRALQRRRSDIRSRYNAYVPGLTSHPRKGVCKLLRMH